MGVLGEDPQSRVDKLIKESLCGECCKEVAEVLCKDCMEQYCAECNKSVHTRGRRKLHTNFVPIYVCSVCQAQHGTKECRDCKAYFCDACCKAVHAEGKNKAHRYIRPVNFSGTDTDTLNGMGLPIADLQMSRWQVDGRYPPHLQPVAEATAATAQQLRGTGEQYVDPDQVTLDAQANRMPPSRISDFLQSEEQRQQTEKELAEYHADTQRRMEEIEKVTSSGVLRPVHGWRRAYLVVDQPALFGPGNTVLADWPENTKKPPNLVSYAPCFQKGLYNDEWFLLAVAQVATNRKCLQTLFVSCDHKDIGMYTFQFYQPGDLFHPEPGWQPVTIDDMIPVDGESTPVFGLTKDADELWLMLLEKAYAKFLGSYTHLHDGDHARCMRHLTGGVQLIDTWDSEAIDTDSQSVLWWTMKENTRNGLFSSAMRRIKQPRHKRDEGTEGTGLTRVDPNEPLQFSHGVQVLLTAELSMNEANELLHHTNRVSGPLKLLKIRNVYGTADWTGDWSATSPLWTKELRKVLGATQLDNTVTWMNITDFDNQFDTLITTQNFPGAPAVFYDSLEAVEEGKVPLFADQFLITIKPKTEDYDESQTVEIDIVLSQPDKDSIFQDYTDGADMPEAMEVYMFHCPDRVLQQARNINEDEEEEEETNDEDVYVKEMVAKKAVYEWPRTDMIPLREDPASSTFRQIRDTRLSRGTYVIAIHQSYHKDDVQYCLSVQLPEPDAPFELLVESLGTLDKPYRLPNPANEVSNQADLEARIAEATALVGL